MSMFKPKLLTCLHDYTIRQFRSDVIAGLIVGVVALPLAIAFAIASGVSPDKGLVTAVVAGLLISALGGSRVQIGGPTGAFVVIVYSIVQKYGIDGLILATLMAGIILMIFGFARFGGVIKFIPYPVTVGFTSGIAVLIASSQINDFLGLKIQSVPADFFEKWKIYFENIQNISPQTTAIAVFTIVIIVFWRKISKAIPGSLIALLFMTVLVAILDVPVETIGSKYGAIPNTLPMPRLPNISFEAIQTLLPSAFTIAFLAAIESLLSAVVADGMIGGRHRSNTELIAQGIANTASALFGGMPATGAIARTATNVQNGGRTPIAGIVHALTLVCFIYLFSRWVVYIPLACLAGILVIVAYHMSEWRSFLMILRAPRSDVSVLLITFLLTVIFDLTLAIEIGIVLSAFLLIHRLSLTPNIGNITSEISSSDENGDNLDISQKDVPDGVEVYEIVGAFFFGVTTTFTQIMNNLNDKPKIRILRMRNVLSIDASALNALRQVLKNSRNYNVMILLSGIQDQPLQALKNSGLYKEIGEANILPNIDMALFRARYLLCLAEN